MNCSAALGANVSARAYSTRADISRGRRGGDGSERGVGHGQPLHRIEARSLESRAMQIPAALFLHASLASRMHKLLSRFNYYRIGSNFKGESASFAFVVYISLLSNRLILR